MLNPILRKNDRFQLRLLIFILELLNDFFFLTQLSFVRFDSSMPASAFLSTVFVRTGTEPQSAIFCNLESYCKYQF